MTEVAEKVAHHVVGKRVRPRDAAWPSTTRAERVPEAATVEEAGIGPLQYVFVDYV